jgi:hypothetical protein
MHARIGRVQASAPGRLVPPGHRFAAASIFVLAFIYILVAFVILKPDATYSIDAVVKLVQARTLLAGRFVESGMQYRGAYIDPDGLFSPLTSPYVFHTPAGTQSIFPTASALLIAPFSPWGLAGVTVPALVSAVLLLCVTWRFARGIEGRWAVPAVLGAATILWFYATSPNEHALSAALTTAALLLALEGAGRRLVAAGLLLGIAATLRDESLLVAPGLVVARWAAGRRTPTALLRDALVMGAAALLPLVSIAALDALVYDRPVSAHLLHAMAPLQRWLPSDIVRSLPALPVIPWGERPDVLVHQWLVGVGTPLEKGVAVAALLAAAGIKRWTGSALGLVVVLGMLAAWRVADVQALVSSPKFVGGLYRLCPFLVFACVPLPAGVSSSKARHVALWTAACYLALAFLGLNTIGGKSFGPRLLFPLLPLLTVAAVESGVAWAARARASRTEGLVGAIALALVATSAVMQFGVALPAWAARNRSDYRTIARVLESTDNVVVIDHPSGLQMTAPFYFDRVVLLAPTRQAAEELSRRLLAARVGFFTVASRFERPVVTFEPYTLAREARDGRLAVQRWAR